LRAGAGSAVGTSSLAGLYNQTYYQRNVDGNCNSGNCNCSSNCGDQNCNQCLLVSGVNCVNCDTTPLLQANCNCACTYNCVYSQTSFNCNCACDCNCGG
jgi:hypothetical protein